MRTLRKPIVLLLIISIFASMGCVAYADADMQPTTSTEDLFSETTEESILSEVTSVVENADDIEAEPSATPAMDASPSPDVDSSLDDDAETETVPEQSPAPEAENPVDATPSVFDEEETVSSEEAPAESASPVVDEEQPEMAEDIAASESIDTEYNWFTPGNTDMEILSGGTVLASSAGLYYSDVCIWLESNGNTSCISNDEGRNLNLVDGFLYYTVKNTVRRVAAEGGTVESVYTCDTYIDQLYVIGNELRFLADGRVYSYDMTRDELSELEVPANVSGLIPTIFGNLYLTGSARNYTLWANNIALRSGIRNCYTEEDWLVIEIGTDIWQTPLEELFSGSCELYDFDVFDDEVQAALNTGLSDEQQLANEAAYLQSEEYAASYNTGTTLMALEDSMYYISSNPDIAYLAGNLSSDQTNIVLRARQMAEVEWTPLKDRYSWGGNNSSYVNSNPYSSRIESIDGTVTYGYFKAGETYRGVPYSQAVNTGYVGWNISLSGFVNAVNDSSSKFYSGYSTYSRTAPYYGSDCSGFVSWAWDLSVRCTCSSLVKYSQYVGTSINSLQVGDCLNMTSSHVVLVTDIGYDSSGNIVAIEITEQTPAKMRVSCYGEQIPGKYYDSLYSMSYFKSYYLNGGYVIYRRGSNNGAVDFTESDAVDLNKGGYARAPRINVTVNDAGSAKVVTLSHSDKDAVIYYTTDGSTPTTSSKKYTAPFQVTKDTTIKAIAACGDKYTGSHVLTYKVAATKSVKPSVALVDGDMYPDTSVTYVSSGTKISLFNEDMDAIYYTTDGSTPTTSSTKMPDSGIKITKDTVLKAIAVGESTLSSEVATIQIKLGTFHSVEAAITVGGIISPSGSIGVLDGKDYTVAIIPDDYYEIKDVKVDGISVGVVDSYTFKSVKTNHTISATFVIDMPFKDVSNAWYTDYVEFAYSQGLVSGTSSTTFSPNDSVTRAMFITILGRFAKAGTDLESWSGRLGITNGSYVNIREKTSTSDTSYIRATTGLTGEHLQVLGQVSSDYSLDGGVWYQVKYKGYTGYFRATTVASDPKTLLYVYDNSFKDIADGAYYNGYVQWGNALGLVKGVDSSSFAPNNYISRQDICVLIHRYLTEYMSYDLSSATGTFTDDASISEYAKTAVYAMKKIGVVKGYEDGSFNPYGYATRAEIATIFANLYQWMNS